MSNVEIILIALGLAMDASAVCLGAAASGRLHGFRPLFRLSFHFGLFQFLMPVAGWYLGSRVVDLIADYDHWIALALLSLVGARMIRSGLAKAEEQTSPDPSRGWALVALAIATSIDALAIGLSLAMLGVRVLFPSAVIGAVTAAMCALAFAVGRRLGQALGRPMELIGGVILIAIGVRIVVEHTLG